MPPSDDIPSVLVLCPGRRDRLNLADERIMERFAVQLSEADGVEVLHQDLNQVVVRFLDPAGRDHDAHSRAVVARAQAEGTCYPSVTVWRGVGGARLSVSSWRTGPDDVDRSVAALLAAHRGSAAGR